MKIIRFKDALFNVDEFIAAQVREVKDYERKVIAYELGIAFRPDFTITFEYKTKEESDDAFASFNNLLLTYKN